MKPRRPCGLRTAKMPPLSWVRGRSGAIHRPEWSLAVHGGCELRNYRHVRRLLGGPAESRRTLTRMRPHRPRGLRTAKLPQRSRVPGRPSGVVSYADQEEASPSLGAASCETVPTFGWSWEAPRSGATRRLECGLAVPGGRELRNRRHVHGPLGDPAEWCRMHIRMRPRRP